MEWASFTLGDLDTNCYLVWEERTLDALIIDPADEGGFLSEEILRRGLKPLEIVLTHGHFDHLLGLLELQLNFGIKRIWLNAADRFLVERAQTTAQHFLGRTVDPIPLPKNNAGDGKKFYLGREHLTVLHTPGHTPGSICLFDEKLLFTGDTLFKDSVGSTDHAYSDSKQLWNSVRTLREQHAGKLALPGHGDGFSL